MPEGWFSLKYNVASVPLMLAVVGVLGLSYAALLGGPRLQFWVHDGLALGGFVLLLYAAHAEPPPEMWRRRLIVLGAITLLASMISG